MSLFNKFKKSKNLTDQQKNHSCPKCGTEMHRETGLTYTFNSYAGIPVDVPNITAMVCDKCNEMYFDWDEAQRIEDYVRDAVNNAPTGVEELHNEE